MDGVTLDDVRRALDAQDPNLAELVAALAESSDPPIDGVVKDDDLTFQKFSGELRSWRFSRLSDGEKEQYRRKSWEQLESGELEHPIPERLFLHEVITELWEDEGPYARTMLLEIVATVPLKWGPWKAIKRIFKESEAKGDTEMLGAIAARLDMYNAGYSYSYEVSSATVLYMVRRAWRYLRRLGQTFPAAYPDAAVDFLRFYNDSASWQRTWIACHIFFHEGHRYNQKRFTFWSMPGDLISQRAFAESWQRTPRPLFSLLEQARSEQARKFAIEALKTDFRTALREVEASWVARLAGVESAQAHEFIVWLLGNVPKFEQGAFRDIGLHEAVLSMLDSPSNDARKYAAAYARTHARDLPLDEVIRLTNNSNNEVRKLAFDLLRERDPRKDVGLDAWGQMLGTRYGHDVAVEALRQHFGARELTPEWFRARLLSDMSKVVEFAMQQLPKVHNVSSLGSEYLTGLFDEEGLGQSAASFALNQLLAHFTVDTISVDFWRRSVLHPLSSSRVRQLIQEDKLKARTFGVEFWRALAYQPSFEEDAWIAELQKSGRPWAKDLRFNEQVAEFARGLLGDVRQFNPGEVGFDWLMELVQRHEQQYHGFAVRYMLKAFVPADFAPEDAQAASSSASGGGSQSSSGTIDLGEKTFLFTGKLATMTRKDAQSRVAGANGKSAKSVTKALDYLVVGDEGSPLFGQGKKGSKMLKAEGLQADGSELKIISETAFLQMLAGEAREEVDEELTEAGAQVLWDMATGPGDAQEPLRDFALAYLRQHHPELGPALTERSIDPGAEVPRDFYTFERVAPLYDEERTVLRRLAIELGKYEMARWSPDLDALVELAELGRADVTEFLDEVFLSPEEKSTERFRLGREHLDVDGVYRFCESLDQGTRRIGMALIALYDDLAVPSALFRLTESPDRQLRAFVIRTIWALYRDKGITMSWSPTPVETQFTRAKTKKGTVEYVTGPGPKPRPDQWPAPVEELRGFMRRVLFEIPPTKLSASEASQMEEPEGELTEEQAEGQKKKTRRVKPIPARKAKLSMVEVMRDLALEDAGFASLIAPLLQEFMHSRGKSERAACMVALTRMGVAYPDLGLLEDGALKVG